MIVLAFSSLRNDWVFIRILRGVKKRNGCSSGMFLLFYVSPLTWDLLQERKQESSRVVTKAPKINQRPPLSCQKNTLSKHVPTRATSWTPAVSSCTGSSAAGYWSARSPLLWPVVTVESTSLVGPQEAVWSFDEAFAFNFSAKVWWPVAGTLPSNERLVSYKETCATKEIKPYRVQHVQYMDSFLYSIAITM